MKKYTANYTANNGTTMLKPIEDTNIKRIISDIREIAEGNRFQDNECKWSVYCEDTCVAEGGMTREGRRYRII